MDILDISGVGCFFFLGGGVNVLCGQGGQDDTPQQMAGSQFTSSVHMCHGQGCRVFFFGMGIIPPFNRESL